MPAKLVPKGFADNIRLWGGWVERYLVESPRKLGKECGFKGQPHGPPGRSSLGQVPEEASLGHSLWRDGVQ